jgi:hypothetical protein
VAARRPRLVYIFRMRRVVAEPTLELLISNPLDLRASVAPAFDEWDLTPLISNCTLRGSDFLSPWLVPRGGYPYSVRNHAIKWPQSCAVGAPFQAAQPRAWWTMWGRM